MAMVPLIRSIRVTVPVPVIVCWANATEPNTVRAAALAKTIFATFMEASPAFEPFKISHRARICSPILHPSSPRRTHHVGFQHRIHHVVRRRWDAKLAAQFGDLAAEPGHLEPVAAIEIERHR